MSDTPANTKTTAIGCVSYRDAMAGIEWLCNVFGFERHAVYQDKDGSVAHAQLSFGNGMIMLSTFRENNKTEYGRHMKHPDQIGGGQTQGIYLVVKDADAVYARAKAAHAKMAIDIKDEDYGGRGFSCFDPEGYIWSIGTYDPWAPAPDAK